MRLKRLKGKKKGRKVVCFMPPPFCCLRIVEMDFVWEEVSSFVNKTRKSDEEKWVNLIRALKYYDSKFAFTPSFCNGVEAEQRDHILNSLFTGWATRNTEHGGTRQRGRKKDELNVKSKKERNKKTEKREKKVNCKWLDSEFQRIWAEGGKWKKEPTPNDKRQTERKNHKTWLNSATYKIQNSEDKRKTPQGFLLLFLLLFGHCATFHSCLVWH